MATSYFSFVCHYKSFFFLILVTFICSNCQSLLLFFELTFVAYPVVKVSLFVYSISSSGLQSTFYVFCVTDMLFPTLKIKWLIHGHLQYLSHNISCTYDI